ARCFSSRRISDEISGGVSSRSLSPIRTIPPCASPGDDGPPVMRNGNSRRSSCTSSIALPMNRFTEYTVRLASLLFPADVERAVFGSRHDRRHQRVTAAVADHDRDAVLHVGDETVGGA